MSRNVMKQSLINAIDSHCSKLRDVIDEERKTKGDEYWKSELHHVHEIEMHLKCLTVKEW